jgi:TetR/AcrR family transcriptional repressor of nem operon
VARPREFDYQDVLREAGDAFWAKGYQATSIQDIAAATGVKPGSLYKAFGDKRSLFLKCVEHYMKALSYKTMLLEDFETPIRQSLRKLFDAIIDSCAEESRMSGCMVTNTAFELASIAPDIADELKRHLGQMERVVRYRIMWAQETGEIGQAHDADSLTAYYITIIQGLLVSSRVSKDRAAMERACRLALGLLDGEPQRQ